MQVLLVCGDDINGNSTISLTVLDHSKIGTHGFLGQAVVDLKSVLPDSYFAPNNAEKVLCEGVKLKRYRLPVPDYKGEGSIKINNAEVSVFVASAAIYKVVALLTLAAALLTGTGVRACQSRVPPYNGRPQALRLAEH